MKTLSRILILSALLQTGSAIAEDIDIFAGAAGVSDRPNVLMVLDNSANWSASISGPNCYYKENGVATLEGPKATNPNKEQGTKMAIEKCALYNTIDALPVGLDGSAKFNVGLMLSNESPASNSGGYPRRAIVPLTAANKTAIKNIIKNIGINSDKSNNAAFAKTLHEAWLYFKSAMPLKGAAGTKWDSAAFNSLGRYNLDAISSCAKNYIIFIANGGPGENTNNEARALLQALGGDVTQIGFPTSIVTNSDQSNWADEYTRFMFGADVSTRDGSQTVVTHGVAVLGASSDGLYPNFIRSMARQGGGNFFSANSADSLTAKLLDIFNRIQSVESVFSAATLPISVNARGTYLNQVFMGMFLPDGEARPRWYGNLKQYKFAYDPVNDSLSLVDSLGNDAINAGTGFITPTARSYWSSASTFWVNARAGTPANASDAPDGEVVQKGGVAQKLRSTFSTSQSLRKMLTCVTCSSNLSLGSSDATRFNTSNSLLTPEVFGLSSGGDRNDLINWVRGADNQGDEFGPGGTVTVRPSIHGDLLHSRPAVINYGTNGVVAFYGTNNGALMAVNGNQTGTGAGQELWSFIAPEHLARLQRQKANSPVVKFPNTAVGTPRDYFFDGPISVLQKFNSAGAVTEAKIFVAMRRGGRSLYAFNVLNPLNPILLWRKTSADIPILGQTWSEARVARIAGYEHPVLIMGAGYDPAAEDVSPAGSVTMGNAVLVLDSRDGTVLKTFPTERPVVADVSLIDSDYDGKIDRAYTGDMGGNLYRIDLEVGSAVLPANWTINKLADLGSDKKFMYAPDVVLTKYFAVVLAGSGDREKPLVSTNQDKFFTVLDRHVGKGVGADFATVEPDDLIPQGVEPTDPDVKGCYLDLAVGEKVVNAPFSIAGRTYFGTNKPAPPSPTSCSANLGIAQSYAVPLLCEAASVTEYTGGGLPPSPVGGVAEVEYTKETVDPVTGEVTIETVTKLTHFIIGGDTSSAIDVQKPALPVTPTRRKLYWFTEAER